MNAPDEIVAIIRPPVLSREDARFLRGGVVERAELPPMPWRRSDAETRQRVAERERRRAEQGPYMRVVITPCPR